MFKSEVSNQIRDWVYNQAQDQIAKDVGEFDV